MTYHQNGERKTRSWPRPSCGPISARCITAAPLRTTSIGFRDEAFDALGGGREALRDFLVCIDRPACQELFAEYNRLEHRIY